MLFKEELPPPRHTLDAGDFSDSDANVDTSYKIAFNVDDLPESADRLLMLAPKCAALAGEIGSKARGRIVVTTVRKSTASETATADFFYECDATDDSEFTSESSWVLPVLEGPAGLLIVVAAALPEAEAAFAGRQIVSRLCPRSVLVATPGLSFMREPVCCLATPGAEPPRNVPLAAPPVLVQGVCAAGLSRARQLDAPALAFIVSADGPVNHEIVDEYKLDALRQSLFAVLGLQNKTTSQGERDISTLYV